MKILFSVLVHLTLCAARDCSCDELMQEMRELRRNLEEQRIVSGKQQNQIEVLQNIVASQSNDRETEVLKAQRTRQIKESPMFENTITKTTTNMSTISKYRSEPNGKRIIEKGRNIRSFEGPVAFYAYMSKRMTGIGDYHPLTFDVVRTNVGNAFHSSTGVFMVPQSGLYVFTWAFRLNIKGSSHSVEIMVNGIKAGAAYADVYDDEDQTSATIVIQVTAGDDVFLRTGPNLNNGQIYSDGNGYTYFAGWKID